MNVKMLIASLAIATSAPLPLSNAAERATPAAPAGKGLHESRTVEKTATVSAIDPAKRLVTLKTADGGLFEVEASADVGRDRHAWRPSDSIDLKPALSIDVDQNEAMRSNNQ